MKMGGKGMKKSYKPPDWEMVKILITNEMLLTGSIESGGDILDVEGDDIGEINP